MTAQTNTKRFKARIRLSKLAAQNGGKSRDAAVREAEEKVEALRERGIEGIETALSDLEAVIRTKAQFLSSTHRVTIMELADRVITLSGTFGYAKLAVVMRSLVDLTNGLADLPQLPIAPVQVHVRVACLFAPRAAEVDESSTAHVLSELKKVRAHFGTLPSSAVPVSQ